MTTTATTATTTTTTTKRNYVSFFRAKDNVSAWNHEKQFFSSLQPVRKWLFRNRKTKTPTHPFVTKLPTAAFNKNSEFRFFFRWKIFFLFNFVPGMAKEIYFKMSSSTRKFNRWFKRCSAFFKSISQSLLFQIQASSHACFCLGPNRAWISHKVATRLVISSQAHLAAELHLRSQSAQTWAVERPSCRKAGSKEKI